MKNITDFIKLLRQYPHHLDAFLRDIFDSFFPILCRLAYFYRRIIIPRKRLIAVIGSLGKTTTTRSLRASILERDRYQSFSNYGSRLAENILRSRPCDQHDVFEVGISGPGEMEWPAQMLQPDIVVVTSIKSDHNRSFPTLEDARNEKVKMVRALSPQGVAILNGDDPHVVWMATQTQTKVITFGLNSEHDIWASDFQLWWPEGSAFKLHLEGETYPIQTKFIGEHMIYPILASVAVSVAEGIPIDRVITKLSSLAPSRGRMEPLAIANGVTFLDDSFKASLESIHAALDTFAQIPAKRRVVVLGDVEEPPGPQGPIYRELGKRVADCADLLLFVSQGANYNRIRSGARDAGMQEARILHASSRIENAIEILKSELQEGDVVLLKGAYSGRYRRILLGLKGMKLKCSVKSCRVKIFFCEECPLMAVDTSQITNRRINQLIRC